jgi:DNA repair ATPase RecN
VSLGERRTVIVVTHRPDLVALADRHVELTAAGVGARLDGARP